MFIKALITVEKGNKVIKRMPRMVTIPGISIDAYRALQIGETVDVSEETATHLIKANFAETASPEPIIEGEEG